MKVFSLILLYLSFSQYCLSTSIIEDFSDYELHNNPRWHCDTSLFSVTATGELQSHLPGSGTATLSAKVAIHHSMQWEIYCRLNFNPSSSNYARFYLYANDSLLHKATSALFLKTGGETGNTDRLELWLQSPAGNTKIWSGIAGRLGANSNAFTVRITAGKANAWEVESKLSSESNWTNEGVFSHCISTGQQWCGLWLTCTSTRITEFYFDNIKVAPGKPFLLNGSINKDLITLCFSQPVLTASFSHSDTYALNPTGTARIVPTNNSEDTTIRFIANLSQPADYILILPLLQDIFGNSSVVLDTFAFSWFPALAPGDLLITELMADPLPSAGMPAAEYIEVYNNSPYLINLGRLTLSDQTTVSSLPNYNLASGSYILMVSVADSALFRAYRYLALSTWPSLNNDHDEICIKDEFNITVHRVEYTISNLPHGLQQEGGYAIELGNFEAWCLQEKMWSWTAAIDGGTAGLPNALSFLNTDHESPRLLSAILESTNTISLHFNEAVDSAYFDLASIHVLPTAPFHLLTKGPTLTEWHLHGQYEISELYQILMDTVADCLANKGFALKADVKKLCPPDQSELLSSEILFNPSPYGVDFIEVYNHSNKALDLAGCSILSRAGGRQTLVKLPSAHIILEAWQYLAISSNSASLQAQYVTGNLFEHELPPLPDENGFIQMRDSMGNVLFDVYYDQSQHQQLLANTEGVSLERISYSISDTDRENWTSSASINNFATPGLPNAARLDTESAEFISMFPSTIDPNAINAEHNQVSIIFNPKQNGYFIRAIICDEDGKSIKVLANNQPVGQDSILQWDGSDAKGQAAKPGEYILYIEYWNSEGKHSYFKRVIGVI